MSERLFYFVDLFRLAVAVFGAIGAVRLVIGYHGKGLGGLLGNYLFGVFGLAVALGLGIDAVRGIIEVLS